MEHTIPVEIDKKHRKTDNFNVIRWSFLAFMFVLSIVMSFVIQATDSIDTRVILLAIWFAPAIAYYVYNYRSSRSIFLWFLVLYGFGMTMAMGFIFLNIAADDNWDDNIKLIYILPGSIGIYASVISIIIQFVIKRRKKGEVNEYIKIRKMDILFWVVSILTIEMFIMFTSLSFYMKDSFAVALISIEILLTAFVISRRRIHRVENLFKKRNKN